MFARLNRSAHAIVEVSRELSGLTPDALQYCTQYRCRQLNRTWLSPLHVTPDFSRTLPGADFRKTARPDAEDEDFRKKHLGR